jgi:acyl carrier protein
MSNATTNPTVQGVIEVLVTTLGIEDRAGSLDETTPLFGELPELDSLAVVELAAALEDRFDVEIDDDAFSAEVFESVGSLAGFIDSRSG